MFCFLPLRTNVDIKSTSSSSDSWILFIRHSASSDDKPISHSLAKQIVFKAHVKNSLCCLLIIHNSCVGMMKAKCKFTKRGYFPDTCRFFSQFPIPIAFALFLLFILSPLYHPVFDSKPGFLISGILKSPILGIDYTNSPTLNFNSRRLISRPSHTANVLISRILGRWKQVSS